MLEMQLDTGEIYSSPEGTDLVEITGSCKDLGQKQNRILVQVYEGEDDSKTPIIDNSIDTNCQDHISTSSLQSVSGCLLVSEGIGLKDTDAKASQYPQCFNGRFGFNLRMGRIIRQDTNSIINSDAINPKVRYLVKTKLRTTGGILADSGFATMVVNRALQTPIFTLAKNKANFRCEINFNPSKFRDIRYTVYSSWSGPSYAASGSMTNSIPLVLYVDEKPTFPALGDGSTIEKYYHKGLMPGSNYAYRMQSGDYSYRNVGNPSFTDYEVQFGSVSGTVERSEISGIQNCYMDAAYVKNRTENTQGAGTPNTCTLTLEGVNQTGYKIEWRVGLAATWMETDPMGGFLVTVGGDAITNCRSLSSCRVHGARDPVTFAGSSSPSTYIDSNGAIQPFLANVPYYFAARHYIDSNINDQFDPGIDQIVGAWSPANFADSNSQDYVHRCQFNTFPAQ